MTLNTIWKRRVRAPKNEGHWLIYDWYIKEPGVALSDPNALLINEPFGGTSACVILKTLNLDPGNSFVVRFAADARGVSCTICYAELSKQLNMREV